MPMVFSCPLIRPKISNADDQIKKLLSLGVFSSVLSGFRCWYQEPDLYPLKSMQISPLISASSELVLNSM